MSDEPRVSPLTSSGHNLPRIPTIGTSPRKAVSKTRANDESATEQTVNLVSTDLDTKPEAITCTPTKEDGETRPPSSMPTPPSESSPGESKKIADEKDCLAAMNTAAGDSEVSQPQLEVKEDPPNDGVEIKMEAPECENDTSESKNDTSASKNETSESKNETSESKSETSMDVDEAPAATDSIFSSPSSEDQSHVTTAEVKKTPRAKTKGDIKKQLQKKRKSKAEPERQEKPENEEAAREQLAKETLAKRVVLLKEETIAGASHLLGDMFWGKVGTYPWWPCMITYDPFEGVYFKALEKWAMYHVQFFGQEEERAWVSEPRLTPYVSKEHHIAWLKENLQKAKKTARKNYKPPEGTRKAALDIACNESEEAIKMDRTARRAQFTLVYAEKPKKPESPQKSDSKSSDSKKKRKLSHSGETQEKSPPRKKQKLVINDSTELPEPSRVQFLVFCSKKKDCLKQEHPEYSEKQLDSALQEQWDAMSEDEKSKFIPMGINTTDLIAKITSSPSRSKKNKNLSVEQPEDSEILSTKRKRKSTLNKSQDDTEDEMKVECEFGDSSLDSSLPEETKPRNGPRKNDETSSQASEDSNPPRGQGVLVDGKYFEPEIFNLFSHPPMQKGAVCDVCEEDEVGEMVTCEGVCQGSFHVSCLGLFKKPSGAFKCDACSSDTHCCFVCKKRDNNPRKCAAVQCGKFYHPECLAKCRNARTENNRVYCPLHVCATCAALEKDPKEQKGKLVRCVRCPKAFHASEYCIAAGSKILAGPNIMCPDHFVPLKIHKYHSHVNVSWCFACSEGGSLICCESCPASYHAACLEKEPPDGEWYCRDCVAGKRPLYGDIIWIKFGSYRWWPGEVCHKDNVPKNIREKPHQVGEFPIRFFGTGEYAWLHRGRVFLFQDGDKGSKESHSAKVMDKNFRKALDEAIITYKLVQDFRDKIDEKKQNAMGKHPAKFQKIKVNKPIGDVQLYTKDPSELSRCNCDPSSENPCGSDSECVNRMTYEECHPAVCPAGERCQNQRFVKRQYPETKPHRFENSAGFGLMTLEDIKKGQFVLEYVGDLIDPVECKKRIIQMHNDNIDDFYFLTLDQGRIIDARPKGNLSRFMNHCCDPNCDTQKWTVNGDTRVGLFANRDIAKGSELTFNYNLDCLGNEKKKCHCGAKNCSGFLGLPPKNNMLEEKVKVKKKKKPKPKEKRVYEDECYRCGYGGELIMCDRAKCPKVYHLSCLKLESLPHGTWFCPWHHCDECGKASVKLCEECPNSFCNNHIEGNIFCVSDKRLICSDHEDILSAMENSQLKNEPYSQPPSTTSCSENGSSTAASDSDSEQPPSVGSGPPPLVKTVLKAQFVKKVAAAAERRNTEMDTLSDSSVGGDENRMPVKKRSSHRKTIDDASVGNSAPSTPKATASPSATNGLSDTSDENGEIATGKSAKAKNGRRCSTQGKRSPKDTVSLQKALGNNNKEGSVSKPAKKAVLDPVVFDDTDSDDSPSLVIDIP